MVNWIFFDFGIFSFHNRFADKIFKFLDDSSNFNAMDNLPNDDNKHANTSPPTAEQEMNNGDLRDKSDCNETSSVNNNHTTASTATANEAKNKRE